MIPAFARWETTSEHIDTILRLKVRADQRRHVAEHA